MPKWLTLHYSPYCVIDTHIYRGRSCENNFECQSYSHRRNKVMREIRIVHDALCVLSYMEKTCVSVSLQTICSFQRTLSLHLLRKEIRGLSTKKGARKHTHSISYFQRWLSVDTVDTSHICESISCPQSHLLPQWQEYEFPRPKSTKMHYPPLLD